MKNNNSYPRIAMILCLLLSALLASNELETQEREEISEETQKKDKCMENFPLANLSKGDVNFYLKRFPKGVFIKNLDPNQKTNPDQCSTTIDSILVNCEDLYGDNPIIPLPCLNPKNKWLHEIDDCFSAKQMVLTKKILLNYQAIRWTSSYKLPNLYSFSINHNPNEISIHFECFYALLNIAVYYLYNDKLCKSDGDFHQAKKRFAMELDEKGLSVELLQKKGLEEDLARAINNNVSKDGRERLQKLIEQKFMNLKMLYYNYTPFIWINLEYKTTGLLQNYSKLSKAFFVITKAFIDEYRLGQNILIPCKIDIELLCSICVVIDTRPIIENYHGISKSFDQVWKIPIFVKSIQNPTDRNRHLLVIEYKSKKFDRVIIRIVDLNDQNINSIVNALTIKDVTRIDKTTDIDNSDFINWSIGSIINNRLENIAKKYFIDEAQE